MFINILRLFILVLFCTAIRAEDDHNVQQTVKACPLEMSCGKVNESSAICRWDEQNGCIRKYPSKCHMDIAACNERTHYSDYSDVYCSMETYICEETPSYERWTIFFGHVKD
ncbi:uncharacterized protein [Drosophila virilis]|uniref:Kazal-like domain-containing protein n=1 Tax=Drosophila virilis TaxID=7244 RepID=A0A0Q9WTM1_DROVI|nr:uncharacterized protein LOC26531456 isoform X1 [Drosophila virilis]KRF84495.1 uncharacterized protein Dvir_GJ26686 [Drosophila virilis]